MLFLGSGKIPASCSRPSPGTPLCYTRAPLRFARKEHAVESGPRRVSADDRRIALSPLGRTGTLVIGRADPSGEVVFTVTGGTTRPRVLRFDEPPSAAALADAIDSIDDWYDDAHGKPDWRRAMSLKFAEEIREELA